LQQYSSYTHNIIKYYAYMVSEYQDNDDRSELRMDKKRILQIIWIRKLNIVYILHSVKSQWRKFESG